MMKLFNSSEIPGRITIALKALALYVLILQNHLILASFAGLPFLPFLGFLDHWPTFFYTITTCILILSLLFILSKKGNYLTLSLIAGSILLFHILSSRLFFGNSITFVACLLVLIGLYKESTFIFRIQISLLYLGAAINKMFAPDWWNGIYFDFFLRDVFDVTLYQSWISEENMTVAKTLGITTIFTELLIGIIVLIPKLTRLTILLGLIFHIGMLVVTSGQLSMRFLFIMSVAFLLISKLKIKSIQIEHRSGLFSALLRYLDFSDSLTTTTKSNASFSTTIDGIKYTGKNAFFKLFLSPQFMLSFYFILIIFYLIAPLILNKIVLPMINLL